MREKGSAMIVDVGTEWGRDKPARGSAGEVFGAFLKLGLTFFGGPIAHLSYYRDELVTQRGWLSDQAYAEGSHRGTRDFALALFCFVLLVMWKAPPWVVVIAAAIGGAGLTLAR